MTIEDLKHKNLILLECISGSRAYGLHTPESDTDIKGVFILPKNDFYAMNYTPQISNETNDIVYYELGRFMELLLASNPNILELLNTPEDSIVYRHPFFEKIDPRRVLSKACEKSFGKFAISQIKKARGLNKKIVNPIDAEKKSVLDFCYVNHLHGSLPLLQFLSLKEWKQEHCGLVKIPQMKDLYGLYHSEEHPYKGIIQNKKSNEVSLTAIPKGEPQVKLLYFNRDGYSVYCKRYKEYWQWVDQRNEARYENTKRHGKNYDTKNMMHTFRLLEMAREIATDHRIHVRRKDRKFLLDIKAGKFEYDELLELAQKKQEEMEAAFAGSNLPNTPDENILRTSFAEMRRMLYETGQY